MLGIHKVMHFTDRRYLSIIAVRSRLSDAPLIFDYKSLSRVKQSQSSTATDGLRVLRLESNETKDHLYRSSMEAGCRTGHLTYSWLPPVRHPPKRLVTNDEDATGESLKHEHERDHS